MNKEYLKSYLYGVEVKIASWITEAVLKREPKVTVMRKVKHFVRGLQLFSDVEKNQLWVWATKFYASCVAGADRETELDKRADKLYSVLRKDTPTLEHVKNEIADTVEFRKKHSDLVEILLDQENRFFYCTVHSNCAAGHKDYQGRIYFKRSEAYSKEEKDFIIGHKLMSVEEVVLGPVWLTTRRNCRHRLVPISFERAKTGDYSDVYKAHEISYEESQYHSYKDRYKMIGKIKKIFADNGIDVPRQMKADIKRTRLLIVQWYRAWKGSK